MAGYRIRRKTKANNYIAVNGNLKLPWAYSNSTDDGTNGVFPEFFYNFCNASNSVNIDIGLVFRGNNGWHLFAYGPNVNNGTHWYQQSIAVSPGQTISVAVYTEGSKVIFKVDNTSYSIPVTSGTAAAIRNGCWISREANLVPQKENLTQCWLLKTNAYFTGAVWSNMTLTTTSSSYLAMSTTNTNCDYDLDPGDATAFDKNCIAHTYSTVNGFVTDNCSIDFTKRNKNICS